MTLLKWGVGALVVLFVAAMLAPFTVVGTGSEAVVLNLGRVDRTLSPGLHWVTPLVEEVEQFDVTTQKEEVPASAASKDLQSVSATIAVNYNIDQTKVADLWTQFKGQQKSVVIDPSVQEAVKSATAKYTAEELVTKREAVRQDILDGLKSRLAPSNIVVTNVSIVNFDFSAQFSKAIEAKVTAEQNALAEKNNLDAAQYQAQAIRVKSEAANNEKYIQLQTLEVQKAAIEKWNGVLPVQMIPGSAVPFINVAN